MVETYLVSVAEDGSSPRGRAQSSGAPVGFEEPAPEVYSKR